MIVPKKVKEILNKYPETRNDDHLFIIRYYQKNYCVNSYEENLIEKILINAPLGSSLVRCRAYLQNVLKECLPSKWVKKQREIKEEKIRNFYSPINNLLEWIFKWFK